jgi:hypothetical protein
MIHRAATSFEAPPDDPRIAVLCVHALDDDDLPLCRGVKREDLTHAPRAFSSWPHSLRCEECGRRAGLGT